MHANIHINAITRTSGRSSVGSAAYRSGGSLKTRSVTTVRSVVEAAAYRAGEHLQDQRDKRTYDYTSKPHVDHSAMLTPSNAPEWAKDRQSFWNAVEAKEKRKDALLAKEALIVLPRNLSHEQHKQVVENWANKNLVEKRGLVVDYAIHTPESSDGQSNPHAHVMYYPRPFDDDGKFGKKLTGFKTPGTVDGTKVLKEFRQSLEDELNAAANEKNGAGQPQKVFDLRSYRERGINKIPQPKIGLAASSLEKKGVASRRGRSAQRIMAINAANAGKRRHIETTRAFGSKINQRSGYLDRARDEIANHYYDVMYGDGTEGSAERENDREL
jgi:hypothetical protein